MIAETLLACWLIASIYLPLLHALTRTPPVEVRRVTNALVVQRASLLAASEPAVVFIPAYALKRWRAVPIPMERAVIHALDEAA